MTDNEVERLRREVEQRLRPVEDWKLEHNEKCKGRDEKYSRAIEWITSEVEAVSEKVERLAKRVSKSENRSAYSQGYQAGAGAIGAFVAFLIVEAIKKFL